MLIRFSCPHCSRAFREEAGMAGTRVRCAGCNWMTSPAGINAFAVPKTITGGAQTDRRGRAKR